MSDIYRENARRTAEERATAVVSESGDAVTVVAPWISYGAGATTISTATARRMARKLIPGVVLERQAMTRGGSTQIWRYVRP